MPEQRNDGTFIFGVILGAIAGAVAALLLTPRSGRELRHDLESKVTETTGITSEQASQVIGAGRERVSGLASAAASTAQGVTGKVAAMDLPFGRSSDEPEETTPDAPTAVVPPDPERA